MLNQIETRLNLWQKLKLVILRPKEFFDTITYETELKSVVIYFLLITLISIPFTLIFYNLLFKNLVFIPPELKSYSVFFIVFGIIYFPLATVFGYLDFNKGTYKAEQRLSKEISPIWRDVFSKLEKLEQENQELLHEIKNLRK